MKEAKAKTSDMMWVKVFGTGSPAFGSFLRRQSSLASFFGVAGETRDGEVGVDFNCCSADHSILPRIHDKFRHTNETSGGWLYSVLAEKRLT